MFCLVIALRDNFSSFLKSYSRERLDSGVYAEVKRFVHAHKAHTVFWLIAVPYSFTNSTFKKGEEFNSNIDLTSCVPLGKVKAGKPFLGGQSGWCILLNCKFWLVQLLLDVWLLTNGHRSVPTVLREKPKAADFLSQRGGYREKNCRLEGWVLALLTWPILLGWPFNCLES